MSSAQSAFRKWRDWTKRWLFSNSTALMAEKPCSTMNVPVGMRKPISSNSRWTSPHCINEINRGSLMMSATVFLSDAPSNGPEVREPLPRSSSVGLRASTRPDRRCTPNHLTILPISDTNSSVVSYFVDCDDWMWVDLKDFRPHTQNFFKRQVPNTRLKNPCVVTSWERSKLASRSLAHTDLPTKSFFKVPMSVVAAICRRDGSSSSYPRP